VEGGEGGAGEWAFKKKSEKQKLLVKKSYKGSHKKNRASAFYYHYSEC